MWPVFSGKIIYGHDNKTTQQMSKSIVDHRTKYNEEPLWCDSMFGGMPAYLVSTIYKGNLLRYIHAVQRPFWFFLFSFWCIWMISESNKKPEKVFVPRSKFIRWTMANELVITSVVSISSVLILIILFYIMGTYNTADITTGWHNSPLELLR